MTAWVFRILRRVRLEIGAGQIVEQHLVFCAEEIAPTIAQMSKEFFLEWRHSIQRGVKLVDFVQTEIAAEQIGQRGALEPVAMPMPFRAWREPALGDEDLEDLIPARAFTQGGQMRGEEGVQTKLALKCQGEPTAAPLTRTVKGKFVHADADHARVVVGRWPVVWKEGDLCRRGGIGRVGIEGLAPGGALGVVDLAR